MLNYRKTDLKLFSSFGFVKEKHLIGCMVFIFNMVPSHEKYLSTNLYEVFSHLHSLIKDTQNTAQLKVVEEEDYYKGILFEATEKEMENNIDPEERLKERKQQYLSL